MGGFSLADAQRMVAADGAFCPWVLDLNLQVERLDADGVRVRLPFNRRLTRPVDVVVGQVLMAVADTVLVLAFNHAMGRQMPIATISLNSQFLRAAAGCDVIAVAQARKLGRSTLFGDVMMYRDGDPAPIAQMNAAFAVLPDDNPRFKG